MHGSTPFVVFLCYGIATGKARFCYREPNGNDKQACDKNGKVRFTAQVRIMRDGETVFTKARTFDRHAHAKQWAADLEAELDKPGGLAKATHRGVTLKRVIEDYLERGSFGRTKEWDMRAMAEMEIAEKDVLKMEPSDIIRHIE